MTRDQILVMEPGNELDKLVATMVMGINLQPTPTIRRNAEPYSTELESAWQVIEKVMEKEKAHFDIELFHNSRIDGRVSIHDREDKEDILLPFGKEQKAGFPKTLTEAICKAAIFAVMDV